MRRKRAHYDGIVMRSLFILCISGAANLLTLAAVIGGIGGTALVVVLGIGFFVLRSKCHRSKDATKDLGMCLVFNNKIYLCQYYAFLFCTIAGWRIHDKKNEIALCMFFAKETRLWAVKVQGAHEAHFTNEFSESTVIQIRWKINLLSSKL